ncbi:MAG: ComEC/Rec2 family competence protein, partial [Clostridia bacterium]|nr:ComEC/Rec2 family competence protein [Clostridia bacterium]
MKKLFNFRPLVFCALSLALGLLSAALFAKFRAVPLIAATCGVLVSFAAAWLIYKRFDFLVCGGAFAIVVILGFFLIFGEVSFSVTNVSERYEEAAFTAVVKSVDNTDGGDFRVILTDVESDDIDFKGTNIAVRTYNSDLKRGDKVRSSAYFIKKPLSVENTYYLVNRVVYESATGVIGLEKTEGTKNFFELVASDIESAVHGFVDEEHAGVLVALLTGRTSGMDGEVLNRFRMAGAAHIFAVSGLHIGLFFSFFGLIFSLFKMRRWQNVILTTLVTLFYALVCSSVSAYRALIMCFVHGMARSFGKKYDFVNSIFLSMIVVLCVFPTSLFGTGFLLSFSAVISLALFYRQFKSAFQKLPSPLCDAISASLAVVLGVTPVLALTFGYASAITVIVNVLLLPVLPLIYVSAMLGAVIAAVTD